MNTQRVVKLNKDPADVYHSKALAAIENEDLPAAELNAVNALLCHPGLDYPYRTLGNVFEKMGDRATAERCFIGQLPQGINDKYFETFNKTTPVFERKYFSEGKSIPIKPPGNIDDSVLALFRQPSMELSEVIVDSVQNGSIWFDGFNRFLFDEKRNVIDEHSRGNEDLIRSVCADHDPIKVEGRLFFVGNRGFNNFYHWMVDILPSLSLFEKAGYTINDKDKILVYNKSSSFQKSTLEHLGFNEEQVLEIRDTSPYYEASEIVMPFFANAMAMKMGGWIPDYLKEKFLDGESESSDSAGKMIYIARGQGARNGRSIGNESELIDLLLEFGIEPIYPEEFSVKEQAKLFSEASVVISTHGAGLTNIVFCNAGTKVLELHGDYMETCYWGISNICGLEYYTLNCSDKAGNTGSRYEERKNIDKLRSQGYSVPLDAMKETLMLAGIV